jgi:hypothetical protein
VSVFRENQPMPPGLKTQIVFAILITAAAVLLPTALSAGGDGNVAQKVERVSAVGSAGSVATSTRAFAADDFPASAYTDWER